MEKTIEYLLARLISIHTKESVDIILKDARERCKTVQRSEKEPINRADVEEIYKAYPTRDEAHGNRSTGKCAKDKQRIEQLLTKRTKDDILSTIRDYLTECETLNLYLKNFSTFLNNIPEKPEPIGVLLDQDIWQ